MLRAARHVDIIAAGKSAHTMLAGVSPDLFAPRQVLCVGPAPPPAGIDVEWHRGAHPVPDEASVLGAQRAIAIARAVEPGDLCLVLLSGGASSMMAAPAEGVTLADKQQTVQRLLKQGASIDELNAVRKHISAVKGGQLAAASRGRVLTLAISDVIGDVPSTIGSGPTVADPTTFVDAARVLARYGGADTYPAAVGARLRRGLAGDIRETPKPGAASVQGAEFRVIGGIRNALSAAAAAASALGYAVEIVRTPTTGEASEAGVAFARMALAAASNVPVCVLAGGETTVTVTGAGSGGRNQECALGMAKALDGTGLDAAGGSVGTDGVDGPTDAAGAIVDRTTLARARESGLDVNTALDDNNSYELLRRLDALIRTGPTGANVGDIQIMLISG